MITESGEPEEAAGGTVSMIASALVWDRPAGQRARWCGNKPVEQRAPGRTENRGPDRTASMPERDARGRPGRPVDLPPGLGGTLSLYTRLRGRPAHGERGMPPPPRQERRPRLLSASVDSAALHHLPSEPRALRGHQGGRGSRCPSHHPVHTRHRSPQTAGGITPLACVSSASSRP